MSPSTRFSRRVLGLLVTATATVASGLVTVPSASASNIVTPGNFTGYGFDQCVAPTQEAMDAWLTGSPYWAVGIYISGDSRGCPDQPNLSATWVDTQLRKGWRLLPITLGPQAWCTTRERYRKQVRINPSPTDSYLAARQQGRREADKTISAARGYGIASGSTLWYDIEAFDISRRDCRESALGFLTAWTRRLHRFGYVSGVYSSAASGIRMLDDARVDRPGTFLMPDRVWIADWNGRADVNSSYVRPDGWMPRARVHQYRGGHNERHGGVTINVDSNWLDLGRGSVPHREPAHCGGVRLNFPVYRLQRPGTVGNGVKAAQCLLKEQGYYAGRLHGRLDWRTSNAVRRFRKTHGLAPYRNVNRRTWMKLTTGGAAPLLKYGSYGPAVRRLQRALNAADFARLSVSGTFEATTTAAVKRYQRDHHLPATGVVTADMWRLVKAATL
jgi:hypothetical protein